MVDDDGSRSEQTPLSRPKILVETAGRCARRYRRARDLPGAMPGLLSGPTDRILPRLIEAETACERDRRAGSAAYRPGRHVQILAALLAESATLQTKASGSTALRLSMYSFSASSVAGSISGG